MFLQRGLGKKKAECSAVGPSFPQEIKMDNK